MNPKNPNPVMTQDFKNALSILCLPILLPIYAALLMVVVLWAVLKWAVVVVVATLTLGLVIPKI